MNAGELAPRGYLNLFRRGRVRKEEWKKPLPSCCGSCPVAFPCVIVLTLCAVMGAEHWSLHSGNILVTRVDISAWLGLIRDTNTPRVNGQMVTHLFSQ